MNDKYWGFLQTNGKITVNRYFGDETEYKLKTRLDKTVVKIVEPFSSPSRREAQDFAESRLAAYRQISKK